MREKNAADHAAVEDAVAAAKSLQAEGTSTYRGHGMQYTVKASITFKAGKIAALHFSSETVKIPKLLQQAVASLAEGKKMLDAVKITSRAVQENAKNEEEHLVETVTGAFHAALRDYQDKQRGKELFSEMYEEVDRYYEGCKPPELKEMSEGCEHSEAHSKRLKEH